MIAESLDDPRGSLDEANSSGKVGWNAGNHTGIDAPVNGPEEAMLSSWSMVGVEAAAELPKRQRHLS